MKSITLKRTLAAISVVPVLFFLFLTGLPGCGSDTTTPVTPPAADTNVVIYDSIGINITGNLGVNLIDGKTTASNDTKKDIMTVQSTPGAYYFESGALASGLKTMFILVDSNYSKTQFDALSTIPTWGTTIDPTIFAQTTTQPYGVLQQGLTKTPVYGFYLQGRFDNHETVNRVYGVIRIRSFTGSGFAAAVLSISVKLNKAGLNKFTQ